MKLADGGFRPAYNARVASDTVTQIILAGDAVNAGSEMAQLPSMLDQIKQRWGEAPAGGDRGRRLRHEGSIKDAYERGVTLFAPVQKPKDASGNRDLPLPEDSAARGAWRERMGTAEAKETYKERAATNRVRNANLRPFSLTCFPLRGLEKTLWTSSSPPAPTISSVCVPPATPPRLLPAERCQVPPTPPHSREYPPGLLIRQPRDREPLPSLIHPRPSPSPAEAGADAAADRYGALRAREPSGCVMWTRSGRMK